MQNPETDFGPQVSDEVARQRAYYAETATTYERMHVDGGDEHRFALQLLIASLDHLSVRSVLDIGSGTGRALRHIKQARPEVRVVGVEPVAELRRVAYQLGLTAEELIDGDALKLPYGDNEFDLCCEFGVLHHIRQPELAIAEMLRVARKAIFISDSNNFGQGSAPARWLKQAINALGFWRLANYLRTGGRGYSVSDGDGLFYSYSVFNNVRQIMDVCDVHLVNTTAARGANFYRSAPHVALLGVKRTEATAT